MRKFISALIFGALLLPEYAFTLGMGDIEVNSALNQQLNARIELISAVPEDAETLIVKLASREEFSRAGLDRPFSLTSLKFKPFVENGKVFIKVTTPKPVREPFLNFLVDVDWPKGHLLREFTILLDPPVFMGQPAASPARPESRPAASQGRTQAPAPSPTLTPTQTSIAPSGFRPSVGTPVAVPAPSVSAPAARPSQTYAPVPAPQQASYSGGDHRIRAGDTAWSLADRMRPDQSVSVEQMMLAMLRINPEVFINENVNGLKKGYILRMPERSDIESISQAEAKALVREQNALWREYQQALGVDQPATAIDRQSESAGGSGIPSRADSRLSIVSAGSGAAAAGDTKDPSQMTPEELRQQLALSREQLETVRVENEGLEGNVTALEQKVKKMQSLLQIEDDSMAEIQSVAEGEESIAADEGVTQAEEMLPEETPAESAALDALDEITGEAAEEFVTDEEAVADEVVAEGEEIFVDELAEGEQQVPEQIEVDITEAAPTEVMPREPKDLIATLLGNPLVAGGAALLALVLLAVGYILVKRRRDNVDDDIEATLAADLEQGMDTDLEDIADSIEEGSVEELASEEVVESLEEAEDEFDADATMILPSDEDTIITQAEPEAPAEGEEERDDVIAEADVYLAYGIYQQAEELLQNAISENPDKDVYRVKLAETYFAGKDSEGMIKLGTEMSEKLAGEETPAWKKIVALGKELCPDAEVFATAGMVADLDIDELMPKSPEPMDIDLGADAGADEIADLDFDTAMEDNLDAESALDETPVISDLDEATAISPEETLGELEFDIGETDALEEAEAELEEEFSLDIEASELDIKTEEPAIEVEEPSIEAEELPIEEDSVEIDSAELDFDMDLSEELSETGEGADVALDADLDFTMDTDEAASESVEAVPVAEMAEETSDEVNLSDLGDVDEVNTKLDLAKAYLDMGDHEGARDILDEVVAGGNDQQKQEAQELLKQID